MTYVWSLCLCPLFLCLRYVFWTYVNSIFTSLWQIPIHQLLLCERRKSTGFTLRDYPQPELVVDEGTAQPGPLTIWLRRPRLKLVFSPWRSGFPFCLTYSEHVSRSCGSIPGPTRESMSSMKPVRGENSGSLSPGVPVFGAITLLSVLWPISLFIKPTSSRCLSTCHLPVFLLHPSLQNTCWHPWESFIWSYISGRWMETFKSVWNHYLTSIIINVNVWIENLTSLRMLIGVVPLLIMSEINLR